jgi:hypothetical protein
MAARDPPQWLRHTPLFTKVGTNFADKRLSLRRIVRSRTKATELLLLELFPSVLLFNKSWHTVGILFSFAVS